MGVLVIYELVFTVFCTVLLCFCIVLSIRIYSYLLLVKELLLPSASSIVVNYYYYYYYYYYPRYRLYTGYLHSYS